MTRRIPITFLPNPLAVKPSKAAKLLDVDRKTVWRLCATGRLRKTDYGVIPVSEIERHLAEEMRR